MVDAPHEEERSVHRLLPGGVALRVFPCAGQERRPVHADEEPERHQDQLQPPPRGEAPARLRPHPEIERHRDRREEEEVLRGEHSGQGGRAAVLPPARVAPVIGCGLRFRHAPEHQHEEDAEQRVFLRHALVADQRHGAGGERGRQQARRPAEQPPRQKRHHQDADASRDGVGKAGHRLRRPTQWRADGDGRGDQPLHQHRVLDVVAGEDAVQVPIRRQPLVHFVVAEALGGEAAQAQPERKRDQHGENDGGRPPPGCGAAAQMLGNVLHRAEPSTCESVSLPRTGAFHSNR